MELHGSAMQRIEKSTRKTEMRCLVLVLGTLDGCPSENGPMGREHSTRHHDSCRKIT